MLWHGLSRRDTVAKLFAGLIIAKQSFDPRMRQGASGYHDHHLAGADVHPLLPKGGEGRGEEATFIECPSPRPSPHSCLTGRGREFLVVESRCALCVKIF